MSVLPVGIGSEEAAGGYQIERSLRFNSADSAYLSRTPASASNRKTWTWSGWVKLGALDSTRPLFAAYIGSGSTDNQFFSLFFDGGALRTSGYSTSYLVSTAVYRDPSAWYHIVCSVDTTSATANNRIRLYVNGIEVTVFSTRNNPTQNTDLGINQAAQHQIGQNAGFGAYFNGYLTEINFIDGSALDPTSFGEFNSDTGVWQPKAYTGTYGTNGFYLNFSDNASTTTLGDDFSGNGNDWTTNNFSVTAGAGNDSLVDSPTRYGTDTGAGGEVRGNYCTLNPLDKNTLTLANGNLQVTGSTANQSVRSTIFVSSGKWYYEATITNIGTDAYVGYANNSYAFGGGAGRATWRGVDSGGILNKLDATNTTSVGTFTTGDIIGCAIDFDADEIKWYKNNSLTVTYSSASLATYAPLCPLIQGGGGSFEVNVNFGQRPFAYTAPSGFKAVVTTNLPTPTIEDGGEYFNTVLYTGDNSASRSITGVGFQPDLVWIKSRSLAYAHNLCDSVRGVNNTLSSNSTGAENYAGAGDITAFNADGFGIRETSNWEINDNGSTYVAWNWKANGAGVSNTAGTITSTVSANTDSGFSIVTYTGNGSAGATIGHGLGVVPAMTIIKRRSNTETWIVWHTAFNSAQSNVRLQSTDAVDTNSPAMFNNTFPTSTLITLGNGNFVNTSAETYVAYCFAPVAGYSAFGSYTGNGSADGPFVYTGFRPAFVMGKASSGTNASTSNWFIMDSARNSYNVANLRLFPNLSNADNTQDILDFTSNGFKIRTTNSSENTSGTTFIYMAFAENPFAYSLAR
jgi:hypothetical protein